MSAKELGKCPECGQWGAFVPREDQQDKPFSKPLTIITNIQKDTQKRFVTGIEEFDRVMGGGVVPGSVVLVGGEPGVGKSTLMLAVSQTFSQKGFKTLYCSGEESPSQVSMRGMRIGAVGQNILLSFENDLDSILDEAKRLSPSAVFIDSVQTISIPEVGVSGSPNMLREATRRIIEFSKSSAITTFLIGHVTKDGTIAGPKTLEHLVDVVCYLEGEQYSTLRILHGVKNRFGATDEVGLIEMTEKGFVPADRHALIKAADVPGVAITAISKGNRPIALEVQALVAPTYYPSPRRVVTGCSINRALMLLAVLEKRANVPLGKLDVYVNLVGGIDSEEPSLDLAMSMALASSYLEKPVPERVAFVGEIGLTGEVRSIGQLGSKLKELSALGIRTILVPNQDCPGIDGLEVVKTRTLREAVRLVWPDQGQLAR